MSRKRLLDFCCKAGGTSMGYHMAGFEVVGVDKRRQPNFPFAFQKGNFLNITDRQIITIRRNFDAVAGSPPCQAYSTATPEPWLHEDLIPDFRWLVQEIGLPYVIENVPLAPLIRPIQICGSALALRVRRHRWFETNWDCYGTRCDHQWQERHKPYIAIRKGQGSKTRTGVINVFGRGDGTHLNGLKQVDIWRTAMGIDWMTSEELAQAIPPAYTYWIGKQLRQVV